MRAEPLFRLFIVGLVSVLAACGRVHETTLDNGLKVIVKEDHRSPVVVSQVWYRVGSSYEPEGLTGISHVLEHMMFKGTTNHKAGEFSRIIAEHGGRENAFTGDDYTAYFQQLEKSRLPISFELEADRMRNLLLKEEDFQREVRVVMEERRLRTEDNPQALTFERFMATAYQVHPYRHPIIGWMEDLERLKLEDLQRWYDRWYAPNNATLVVVGDVEPQAVFALAKKYFGPVPARKLEPVQVPLEPPQKDMRRAQVRVPAEVPYLLLGYHAPAFTGAEDREQYALAVAAAILSGGQSARFASRLVRGQEIAADVGAEYNPASKYPPLFIVGGAPAAGKDLKSLEAAVREEIERLRDEPVSDVELDRVKAQVVAGEIYERDSVFGQAMVIGTLETIGLDWRLEEEYVRRVRAVTAADVQAAVKKYLVPTNLTVVALDPLPLDRGSARPPRPVEPGHVH